jgi:elongation factor P
MFETNQFRKGLKVEIDGEPYIMTEAQFVKPGKGQAFTRTRLKSLITGNVLDRTYKTGEKLAPAHLEEKTMQFLYQDPEGFHFMDTTSFEQVQIQKDQMGDAHYYLLPETEATVLFYKERAISVEVPNFVVMPVADCEPGVRGDTATGATKNATMGTGLVVRVPLFVDQGEKLRIDTRTGEYVERVK